ncbi:MAG: ABC transporter permease [Acidobacteria bacterium]|nr:ABC transporter permease [Acidobacteriota bacterium]
MHPWLQDLRYAFRMLRRAPGLTLVMVLSLAIGIGANTAVFSVVDALLLRPLPYPEPQRLAAIWLHSPGIGIFRDWPSPGQYIDLKTENRSFEEISISRLTSWTLTTADKAYRIDGMRTSSNLLRMLGARPLLGRILLPEDDVPGKTPVAVLSHASWQRLFNSDPGIVGGSITLNGNPFVVAGVLRPEFKLDSEVMPAEGPMDKMDLFVPLPLGADAVRRRGDENYNLVARLKPGVTLAQAQADVDAIASRIRTKDKRDRTFGMTVIGLQEQVVGDVRRTLLVLLGSVILVLLSACANVANILLTRAAGRQKEIAIRTALGARWQRVVRQLMTESLLLALMGGAAGLVLAEWSIRAMRSIHPGNIPRLGDISIDGGVLAFTFAVSLITGLLFGVIPAWRTIRVDLNTSLKYGGRSGQAAGAFRLARRPSRGLLVVSELALSLMLLIGAGLLIRSYARIQSVPPGFATDRILSMRVSATGPKYREEQAAARFYSVVGDRIAHLPGVISQGIVSTLPLTGAVGWGGIDVEGYTPQPGQELQVDLRVASPDYFRTMEIPLRGGRYFSDHDTPGGMQVAIVDDRFARRFWPHDNPVGKHVWFDVKKPITIVGIVGTVKQYGLDDEGKIAVYFPHRQAPGGGMYLVARTASDPASLASAIAGEIHSADPTAAVYEVRTMRDRLYGSLARERFSTAMLGAFALFAMILAAIGVYGVMSYLVAQSARDIGVRMALGAQRGNILGMVLRQGMELAALGIALGLAGAFALTRLMAGLLFGIGARDPLTYLAVALALAAITMLATYVPARRATGIDPIVALREE